MAKTNFLVFAENAASANVETDADYLADSQRVSGVVPGIAVPKMHNKLYKQSTIFAAALAQVIVQAGYDAMDSDYSGLVQSIRHTFAGSVNGVKPDANGNIDLTAVINKILQMAMPRVGDVIITRNRDNPSTKYEGTTWELLKEDTYIISAGNGVKVGTELGSNTHTNTVQEMAPHSHSASTSESGTHAHSASCETTGAHHHGTWGEIYDTAPYGIYDWNKNHFGLGSKGDWDNMTYNTSTDGAHSHRITINSAGNHVHSVSIRQAGNGATYSIRPRSIAFYIWVRTA